MRVRRVLVAVFATVALGGLAACEPDNAVNLVVNTTADEADAAPGDGVCASPTGGCTLRAAIQEANTQDVPVVIDLAVGATYRLTVEGRDEEGGASGDLDVVGDRLTIHGHGSTVDGGILDRVLDHRAGALTIDDLHITGGYTDNEGGGIRTASDLVLIRVNVDGNYLGGDAPGGLGIHQSGGVLMLIKSTVSSNSQNGGHPVGPSGGLLQSGGVAYVLDSVISGNTSVMEKVSYHPFLGFYIYGTGAGSGSFADYRQTGGSGFLINSVVSNIHPSEPYCVEVPLRGPDCSGSTWRVGAGVDSSGQLEIVSSRIIEGNGDTSWRDQLRGTATVRGSIVEGCYGSIYGSITSLGYNRFGSGCPVGATDRIGGSDVDQIPIGTPGLCDGTIATDRLDTARPQGAACDIGDEEH